MGILFFPSTDIYILHSKTSLLPLAIIVIFIAIYLIYPFNQQKAYFIACFAIGALARILSESVQISKKFCDIGIVLLLVLIFCITNGHYEINFLPLFAMLFGLIALCSAVTAKSFYTASVMPVTVFIYYMILGYWLVLFE